MFKLIIYHKRPFLFVFNNPAIKTLTTKTSKIYYYGILYTIGGGILKKYVIAVLISGLTLTASCSINPPWRWSGGNKNNVSPTPKPTITVNPTAFITPAVSIVPTVSYIPDVSITPAAFATPSSAHITNDASLPVFSPLDNTKQGWGYRPNSEHRTPEIPQATINLLERYSGYYVGDTSSKVIYMTFDEGYENGYTGRILDILKANNVPAAFFVTRPYITQNPDLIKRMTEEGHIVGNHTSNHPSMPDKTGNPEAFKKEFTDVEDLYKELTGQDMPKFFRPPKGEFSEKSLAMTQQLGYKTIFWSFAHKDWLVDNQPDINTTYTRIMKGAHNGEIMLLHAVSKSNTEALDSIIKDLKAQGYRFASLEELPER